MTTKSLFAQRLSVERELDQAITCLYLSPTFKSVYLALINTLVYQLRVLDEQIQALPIIETINLVQS